MLRIKLLWLIVFCWHYTVNGQTGELCGNGIDDDGDNLIDCYDNECYSDPSCAGDGCTVPNVIPPSDCPSVVNPVFGPFDLFEKWATAEKIETRGSVIVADLDDDCMPEVLTRNTTNGILIFNGATGVLELQINLPAEMYDFYDAVAVADVDGDDFGEIFAITVDRELLCYEHDGTMKWQSGTGTVGYTEGQAWTPLVADFDYDGIAEVYCGNQIFNALTGNLIAQAGSGASIGGHSEHAFPMAADVLPDAFCADCQGLELVCGNQVYSIDIPGGTMTLASQTFTTPEKDGYTTIADWDGDNQLDIVVSAQHAGNAIVYVWNPRNYPAATLMPVAGNNPFDIELDFTTTNTSYRAGHPNVSDYDNDGQVEIGIAGQHVFGVIDNDMTEVWSTGDVFDDSGLTTTTVFDFEGDGIPEVVYRDEDTLYVYDGASGTVRGAMPCYSQTRAELPTIADVDNDGIADIVCACSENPTSTVQGYVKVFNSTSTTWVSTRNIWNQHSYYPVVINDNLTIPIQQQNHAYIPRQNVFLSQAPVVDSAGTPIFNTTYNLGSDLELCDPPTTILSSGVTDLTQFNVSWYRDNVLEDTNVVDYTVNQPGTYILDVDGPGDCDDGDTIVISAKSISVTNTSYCGPGTPTVSATHSSGNCPIVWYDASTGGSRLGTGCNYTFPTVTGDQTVYAEDTSSFSQMIAYSIGDAALSSPSYQWGNNNPVRLDFSAEIDFTLDSVTVEFENYSCTGTWTTGIRLADMTAGTNQDFLYTLPCVSGGHTVTIPVGFVVTDNHDYQLSFQGGTTRNVLTYSNGADYATDLTYPGLADITNNGVTWDDGVGGYGAFFDWVVTVGDGCSRAPALAISDCAPSCTPPTTATLATSSFCTDSEDTLRVTTDAPLGYLYSWYDGATLISGPTTDFDSLIINSTGNYKVRIADPSDPTNGACYLESNVIVPTINSVIADAGADDSICNGQASSTITATGGVNYFWDNGLGSGTSHVVSPSSTTTYTVIVTDANGCTDADDVMITVHSLPIVDAGSDVSICPSGTTTIMATGANTYDWDNGLGNGASHNVSPASTTTYIVTATDVNGCIDTDDVIVSVNSIPEAEIIGGNTFCDDSTTTLSMVVTSPTVSPYNFTYTGPAGGTVTGSSPQDIVLDPTQIGTYTLTNIVDANGCAGTITGFPQTIDVFPELDVTDMGFICDKFSGTYEVEFDIQDGTVGYTINGEQDVNSVQLAAGIFTSAPIPIDTITQNGNYEFIISDASGCNSGIDTISSIYDCSCSITGNISAAGPTTFCDRDSVEINVTMSSGLVADYLVNYEFTPLSTGTPLSGTFNQSGDGNYLMTVITESGTVRLTSISDSDCSTAFSQEIEISSNELPEVLISGGSIICDNGVDRDTVFLTVVNPTNGPYNYNYETPSGSTINVTSGSNGDEIYLTEIGTYNSGVVIDANGCAGLANVSVTVSGETPPAGVDAGNDFTFCGTDTNLNAQLPLVGSGTWSAFHSGAAINDPSSETTSVTIIEGDTVTFVWTVSNGGRCPSVTDDVTVTSIKNATPTVAISTTSGNPVCEATTVVFNATSTNGGTTPSYLWTIDGLLQSETTDLFSANSFTEGNEICVSVTSDLVCATPSTSLPDCYTISVLDSAEAQILNSDDILCETSLPITLAGLGSSGTYSWSGPFASGETSQNLNVNQAGTYTFTVDNGVCPPVTSNPVTIEVESVPSLFLTTDLQVDQGASVLLEATTNGHSVIWTGSDIAGLSSTTISNPIYTPQSPTAGVQNFQITAYSEYALCETSEDVDVLVITPITIPNAFTPNGDAENDEWNIQGLEAYDNVTLTIYNRWGSVVHKSVGLYNPWTGLRQGKPMPVATYYYILEIPQLGQKYHGSVTLLK